MGVGMEIVVNGKKVVLREYFPAEEYWSLYADIDALANPQASFEAAARFLTRVIEAWDFSGSPAEIDSYRKLDLFREMMPLLRQAPAVLLEISDAKN